MATPLRDLQDKVLTFVTDAQAPAADYVAKAAEAVADRLPEDRPEPLNQGIDLLVDQVDFATRLLDAQTAFVKAVLGAAVKPFKPAKPHKTTAAKAA